VSPPEAKEGRARSVNLAENANKERAKTQEVLKGGEDEKSEEIDIFIHKLNYLY